MNEQENLEELLTSAGWRAFTALALEEWGDGGTLSRIYADPKGTEQILYARVQIAALMELPQKRLDELRETAKNERNDVQ